MTHTRQALLRHLIGIGAVAGALLATGPAWAADPPALAFLTPADIDPARLLPPPPADGSPEAVAEVAELHRIGEATTPDGWTQAMWDNDHEDGTIFQTAIAPGFDLAALPATAHLLAEVRHEEAIAASRAKDYFKRTRPWIVDDSLKTCSRDEKPQTSYPSGHATMAYTMAVVLAQALPDEAQQIMTRARDYSENRLVCGMHYRADIVGGQALGTAVASDLLRDPRFQHDLAAAEQELRAAHLIAPTN
ncbi:MAG TPA: phosphatase PAP2 family protein [Caulobacteraceae bacterium]|nr:phosphatase PAP2 family protein [Caulobacteraceae bacterium]